MSADAPFFRVRLKDGAAQVEGDAACRLGQVALPEPLRTGQEVFGEWRWDGTQVVLRTCRYGFFPLYYYATANEFGVSSSLPRLIEGGAPTGLDDAALATFLRLGWLVGDDTVFRAIRTVPPNGEVRWSDGRLQVGGGHFYPRTQHLSRTAAIEGFGELFLEAVRRRTARDVPTVVPLSGGRDSRHILLAMAAVGCPPQACFTTHDLPPYREGNIRAAALLCARLGIEHRVVGQPASRLQAERRKNRDTGFCALEHAWAANLFAEISRSASIVYDGLAGDALSASAYLKQEQMELFERGRIEELAARLVENWSWRVGEEALGRILTDEAMRRFPKELAVQRVAQELATHAAAAIPLKSFNFWNRTRRATALSPFGVAQRAGVVAMTPYLDHEVFDFLASLPAGMLLDRKFHTDTIQRRYPEFRDVPFAGDLGAPLKQEPWHQRRFLAEAGLYLAASGGGGLLRRGRTAGRLLALAMSPAADLHKRAANWIAPLHVVYLAQLAALCRGHVSPYGAAQPAAAAGGADGPRTAGHEVRA